MRYEDRIDQRGSQGRWSATGTVRWGVSLMGVLFFALVSPAFSMDFNANWDYSQSGGEGVPTQNEFRQRYNLGTGSSVTARPSHALTASAGVSYTRSQGNDSRGSRARDELTPYAQVSLMNDIFTAQLSGTTDISTPDDHRSSTASSWNSSLASSWDIPFWPQVRLNYGEQTVEADDWEEFPDQTVTNRGLSLDWDLLLAQINYQYNTTEMEVEGSNSKVESDSHFVRLETGGTLLQNRLRFHLTQNYTRSNQELHSGGGLFPFPVSSGVDAGIIDNPTLDFLPGEGLPLDTFSPGEGQDPNDLNQYQLDPEKLLYISFTSEKFPPESYLLRIIIDPALSEEQLEDFEWQFYIKEASGWMPAPSDQLTVLPPDGDQILIRLRGIPSGQDVTVTALNNSIFPLNIVRWAFYRENLAEPGTSSSTTTNSLTNLSLGYRITRHLSASGSLILNRSEFNDGAQENNRQTVSGSLRYTANPLLVPSLGYSESRNEQTGEEDRINRSYSLVLSSVPLPTANLSFGITLGEQYLGSLKTNNSTRYTLSSRAAIYPDLSAAALISYGESEHRQEEGGMAESDSLSGRLNLHARLRPNVTADLTTTYFQSQQEQGSRQGGEVRTGLRYRPSEVLSLRGAYTTYYGDEERSNSLNVGATLSLLNTPKTRLTLNASHYQQEDSRQSFSLLGNWNMSRNLSLWSRANYLIADTNVYSFQVNLSLRL